MSTNSRTNFEAESAEIGDEDGTRGRNASPSRGEAGAKL
jgi:hypothetical protein